MLPLVQITFINATVWLSNHDFECLTGHNSLKSVQITGLPDKRAACMASRAFVSLFAAGALSN